MVSLTMIKEESWQRLIPKEGAAGHSIFSTHLWSCVPLFSLPGCQCGVLIHLRKMECK